MKKIISLIMVLCIMASLCTVSAFAEGVPLPTADITWYASGGSEKHTVTASSDASTTKSVGLNYAVNYKVDNSHGLLEQQKEEYRYCGVDFRISVSGANDDTFVYGDDVRLYGYYNFEPFIPKDVWVDLTILAGVEGQSFPTAINSMALGLDSYVQFIDAATYDEGFSCGVEFSDEFLARNPDIKVSVDLVMEVNGEWIVVAEPVVADPPFDIQDASDTSASTDKTVMLPAQVEVEEPVKVADGGHVKFELNDTKFDGDEFVPAASVDSIFDLGKGATVTITNVEGTPAELAAMRKLVSKDYCVRQGSIIITDSHKLGSDGKCTVCDVQVVSNPYSVPATADNSNMPLWTILFIGFAAVALLTGKKKKA